MEALTSCPSLEEQQQQQHQTSTATEKGCFHKTKLIQFLGRTTPIILQNDNGPCPLVAICNVLLLRSNLNLSPDTTEVSQEKLLSLVAERLIDTNSNLNNKEAGYIENQQQNIADAIDLLPRLATGIDVNIKFRRIDDFEFTPECAIFDLLDIPLYHGWIVDAQDYDTANAIVYKSYNALMGELVALETQTSSKEHKCNPTEDDCIDFAAATTATLGVPSPYLSRARSFDDPSHPVADSRVMRKGDLEEEAELLRALKLSVDEVPNSVGASPAVGHDGGDESISLVETKYTVNNARVDTINTLEDQSALESDNHKVEVSELNVCLTLNNKDGVVSPSALMEGPVTLFSSGNVEDHPDQSKQEKSDEVLSGDAVVSTKNVDSSTHVQDASLTAKQYVSTDEILKDPLRESEKVGKLLPYLDHTVEEAKDQTGGATGFASSSPPYSSSDSSSGRLQHLDETDAFTPSIDDEPIYEGEECMLDSHSINFEDEEPVYEGEAILTGQTGKSVENARGVGSEIERTPQQGELVRNFLKNNASQLTFYGLFCLQDSVKERELCVFFRNNHFSTMFKYEGELYLLATDQGYITQPDLVWEKLNEVNGNTLFMNGNFKEFNAENGSNNVWDEHNALASTADFLAGIDSAAQAGFDVNSDLQLAIVLQQQEFEQQQQRHGSQKTSIGSSRLVTGPQVPRIDARYASSSDQPDSSSKDKCSIM